ncbi:Rsm22-domain-containing protein [Backusella circina FSU 941]|nr:Rsm22-domain-containing protein [Backusella circina FSU 941]
MAVRLLRRFYTTEKAIFLTEKQLKALSLENSEFIAKEINISSETIQRSSKEADFGRKRIGAVTLPKPLIQGITNLIEENDKRLIRTDALRLYESLRSTSRVPKESVEPYKLSFGPRESIAYAAGVLPSNYAAIKNIMSELSNRLPDFKPVSMLDFGTGPGTAIWAAREHFNIDKCTAVDLSEDMLRVAEYLEESVKTENDKPIEFKRYFAIDPKSKTDLVISAFTLGDVASEALQKSTIEQLWEQTKDVLVLIDRGTPIGFSHIARARQWVLDLAGTNGHVVAPCPHDKLCPLLFSPEAKPDENWCHFSQRVQRPPFLMKTKHSKFNSEDAKYSYVILRKGPRPVIDNESNIAQQAYQWPRLIQPPLKKNGHVVMDVCASQGEIQRMVIPKSQGKLPYRDARKAMWGDLFPHASKNKVVTRVTQGIREEEDEKKKKKNKA